MTWHAPLTWFGPLLCALAAGCSSEQPEDPLKSATGFCGEWGKNVCVEAIVDDCASPSQEECQQAQRDFCLERVSEKLYTGVGAEECLAFLRDAYRDEEFDREERDAMVYLAEPCNLLLSGSGDAGDECNEDSDCNTVEGLACVTRFGEPRGECQVPELVEGGEKCTDAAAVCEEGFYCDGRNCIAESEEGEECSADIPCDATSLCVIAEDAEAGECEPRKRNGDGCVNDSECQSALCDRNEDEEEGFCVPTLELNVRTDLCEDFR